MTDTFRHAYGDVEPRMASVDLAEAIEIGDLCYLATDDVRAAGQLAWNTNIAGTQEDFHDVFFGVALQRKRATTDIAAEYRFATKGVFRFACASATWEVGDIVGAADSGSSTLLPQTVVTVATNNLAIGRVARREAASVTSVLVAIESTVAHGGVQTLV